jgi:hypothetical protein
LGAHPANTTTKTTDERRGDKGQSANRAVAHLALGILAGFLPKRLANRPRRRAAVVLLDNNDAEAAHDTKTIGCGKRCFAPNDGNAAGIAESWAQSAQNSKYNQGNPSDLARNAP